MTKRKVKKKKKNQKKNPSRYKPSINKLRSKGGLDKCNAEVHCEPLDMTKMSEVIIEFIEPYLEKFEYTKMHEGFEEVVMLAIVVWNTTLLPEEKQKHLFKEMIKSLASVFQFEEQEMKIIIEELRERKNTHFSAFTRVIVDYEVLETRDGFHLSVTSATENPS